MDQRSNQILSKLQFTGTGGRSFENGSELDQQPSDETDQRSE